MPDTYNTPPDLTAVEYGPSGDMPSTVTISIAPVVKVVVEVEVDASGICGGEQANSPAQAKLAMIFLNLILRPYFKASVNFHAYIKRAGLLTPTANLAGKPASPNTRRGAN